MTGPQHPPLPFPPPAAPGPGAATPAAAAAGLTRALARHGITRPGRAPGERYIYYVCPHDPKNPRHAQAHPDHPRVSVKEEIITAALTRFMDTYLLGHDRAAMLQVQLPAGAAERPARCAWGR